MYNDTYYLIRYVITLVRKKIHANIDNMMKHYAYHKRNFNQQLTFNLNIEIKLFLSEIFK